VENDFKNKIQVQLDEPAVILAYKGIINNMVLSVFTRYIEDKLIKYAVISKKINRVLIELAQNISYYSEDQFKEYGNNKGMGIIFLKEEDDRFKFTACNKIKNELGSNILSKCEYINSLTKQQLVDFRAMQRNNAEKFEKRCNIGLIQVAIISSNKLLPRLIRINEQFSYYVLNIIFNKN